MDLKGKTILTTRATAQSGELRTKLEQAGARVIDCPQIEIAPIDDWSEVDDAIFKLDIYQWLLFTSVNAVDGFMKRAQAAKAKVHLPIAVVGSSTAQRLREWNLEPKIVPKEFSGEGLLEAMPQNLAGSAILFPRAETAGETLPAELRLRGAKVHILTVYRTVKPEGNALSFTDLIAAEKVDCIVFASPSAIRHLADSVEQSLPSLIRDVPIAVVGPVTRDAAVFFGLRVSIMPAQSTTADLVRAIQSFLSQSQKSA